jgi:hypothetical protein
MAGKHNCEQDRFAPVEPGAVSHVGSPLSYNLHRGEVTKDLVGHVSTDVDDLGHSVVPVRGVKEFLVVQ